MKAVDIDITLIDGYLKLLDNLSTRNKLYLISKLSMSIKTDSTVDKKKSLKKSFGSFDSTKSAEEIIKEIRDSRTFTREIESF